MQEGTVPLNRVGLRFNQTVRWGTGVGTKYIGKASRIESYSCLGVPKYYDLIVYHEESGKQMVASDVTTRKGERAMEKQLPDGKWQIVDFSPLIQ